MSPPKEGEEDDKVIFLRRNNLKELNKWLDAYDTYPERVPKNIIDKMGTLRRVWVKKQDGGGGFSGGTVASSGDAGVFTPTYGGNGSKKDIKKKKKDIDLLKAFIAQKPAQVFGATVCNECAESCRCGIDCECEHDCICPDLYVGQGGTDLILSTEWICNQGCDGPLLEKQGNVITTPTGKDGKFASKEVPTGSSVWITVTDPQSPLHGRAIMITKRPDGLFALTGGAGQKSGEVEARRHLVLTGTPKKTKRDTELEEEIQEAKRHNEPLLSARKEITAESRKEVREAADNMLKSIGMTDPKPAELKQKRDDIQNHIEDILGDENKSEAKRMTDVIMRNATRVERSVGQRAANQRQQTITRIGRRLKTWDENKKTEVTSEFPSETSEPASIDEILEEIPQEELDQIIEEESAGMSPEPPPMMNLHLPDIESLQELTPAQQESVIVRHFDNEQDNFHDEGRTTEERPPQDDIPHLEIGDTVQERIELKDKEALGSAINNVQSYWDKRHQAEELTSQLKRVPLTQVNPSTLADLRDSIEASQVPLSIDEIEDKMNEEVNHHLRNASALRLYDVIGEFWNDDTSLAEELLKSDTKDTVMKAHVDSGAATALAAIAKEHLGLRVDAKRLIESGNVELACHALAYEIRQKFNNPDEYQAILDKVKDFNATNQRQTEVTALERHDKLAAQKEEIERQRGAGELVDEVKIDNLLADNLIERRKNLGNTLGSLQTSATIFDALSRFKTAKSSTVSVNVGENPDDLQSLKERLKLEGRAIQRYSEDVSDPGNLTLNVDVGALGRFISLEKDVQAMTDRYEKIKTDDSGVEEDDEGNMNVIGHEVPFWKDKFNDENGNEIQYNWRVEQRNDMNWLLETSKKTQDNPTGEGGGLITRTTGAGKTNTALGFYAHKISEDPNYKALVAVPKGRSAQWVEEANRFMETGGDGPKIEHIPDGMAKADIEEILSKSEGGTIYIMGHQELSKAHETLEAIQTADELKEHRFHGLTLDEPQELQARGGSGKIGAVGKRLMRIPMTHKIGLTATPARTKPSEAYDLIKWTSGAKDIGSRTGFERTFGGFGSGTNAQDTAISGMYYDTIKPYISGDRLTTPTFSTTHNQIDVQRTDSQVQRQTDIESTSEDSINARRREIMDLVRNETLTNPDGSRHPDATLVRSLRRSKNWENLLPRAATRTARKEHEQKHTENFDSHPAGSHYSENGKVNALADGLKPNRDQKHVIYIDSRTQRNAINGMLEDLGYSKSEIKNIASSTTSIRGSEMGDRAKSFRKDDKSRVIFIDKNSASGYNLQSGDQLHVMGAPVDAANYLQAQGRIARMPRVGDININTYRYSDNPTEQAHWNEIDSQLKILQTTSPGLFAGTSG